MSEGKIYTVMLAVMADIDPIAKARQNEQQGFRFRSIDDVYDALHPALVAHGVVIVPEVRSHELEEYKTTRGSVMIRAKILCAFRFYADDGSSIEAVTVGEAADSLDKASAKAMSVAYKYALFQTFCIPTGEDSDADSPEPPGRAGRSRAIGGQKMSDVDRKKLWAKIQIKASELGGLDARAILTEILAQFNVNSSADIPKRDTKKVFHAVEDFKPVVPGQDSADSLPPGEDADSDLGSDPGDGSDDRGDPPPES